MAKQPEIIPENCVSLESEIVMPGDFRSVLQDLPYPKHSLKSPRISSPGPSAGDGERGRESLREAEDTWKVDKVNGDLLFF